MIAGIDENGPQLFHADPSGYFVRYDAKAIGSGSEGAQSELQDKWKKVSNKKLRRRDGMYRKGRESSTKQENRLTDESLLLLNMPCLCSVVSLESLIRTCHYMTPLY